MDSEQTPTFRKIFGFHNHAEHGRSDITRKIALALAIERKYYEFVGEETDAFMGPTGVIDISAYVGQKWAIETLVDETKVISVALEQLDHPEGVVEVQRREDLDLGNAMKAIEDIFEDLGVFEKSMQA